MNPLRRLLVVSAVTGLLAVTGVTATPAWAAGSVSIVGPDGTTTVAEDRATRITVSGSGFQSIPKGFGGVYVLFGWVDDVAGGSWRPSVGGVAGEDYRYVPDAESADNNGYQRFLAFPGSETEGSANGTLGADGAWSVELNVPGAVFESQDRDGRVVAVDCREVTCGVITIGAHGVKNANNETFTPVSFAAPTPTAESEPAPAAPAESVRVGVETNSVEAGSSIVFTGQGFTPGEQVVAALDGGLTAVGPLTAGAQGEVAAALPVPRDIRNGTHLVTVRGAGSGNVAETEVTVIGGIVEVVADPAGTVPTWAFVLLLACIVLSLVLVIASVVTAIVRGRERRRAARRRVAAAGEVRPDAPGSAVARPDVPSSNDVGSTASSGAGASW